MIYQLINLVLAAFSLVECLHVKIKKFQQAAYIILLIFFILFAGTRMMGFDYDNYKEIFGYTSSGDFKDVPIEIGWSFISYLFSGLGFDLFLLFIAFCSIFLYGLFFKRYSPYLFLSLLIYYSSYFVVKEMGQMRHGIALGLATLAFTMAMEKKVWQFSIILLAAFLLHYSAIVVAPAYYLANNFWRTKNILICVVLAMGFTFVDLGLLMTKVISILPITGAQDKVANVVVADAMSQKLGFNSSTILRLVIMGLLLGYRQPLKERYAFSEAFVMLYFYGLMLYLLFNSLPEFAQRTSAYFRLLEVIILPCIVSLIRRRFERMLIVCLLVLNSVITISRLFVPKNANEAYIPYKTYLLD